MVIECKEQPRNNETKEEVKKDREGRGNGIMLLIKLI